MVFNKLNTFLIAKEISFLYNRPEMRNRYDRFSYWGMSWIRKSLY